MGFDYSEARFYMDALQLLGIIGLAIYTHLTQRSKANSKAINTLTEQSRKELEAVSSRVGEIERRTDVIESQMNHSPTHHDLAVLHKRVTRATEQLERVAGEFRATNHTLGLIQEHLLNGKGGDS